MANIFLTGGAGYVGAVLVPKLLAKGHRVKVVDLFLYADETMFAPHSALSILRGDLRESAKMQAGLEGIDTVINLAGVSNDPSSDLDPKLTAQVNIEATQNLIELSKAAGVRRFINASSSSVYGIKNEPNVTEELSLEPLTVYSESKVLIERYLAERRGKMTAISVRSATVCGYSPRMRLDLTVNILTHHALLKNKITVFGGVQKRPNIHIDDITDLYAELTMLPAERIDGRVYNACGGNHTVMELAQLVKKTVAPEVPIEVVPTNDLRSYHISAEKIKAELGFVPKKTIANAIEDVAAAFRDRRIADPENDRHYNVRTMKRVLGKA